MSALVYVNGTISRPEEAKISVYDRGFLFGDGIYEAGRTYDRCALFLEEHWDRFRKSAARLQIPVPWTDQELTDSLYKTLKEFGKESAYFRPVLTRGVIDHVGLDVSLNLNKPTLLHYVQDLPDLEARRLKGMKLITAKTQRNSPKAQDPNIKTCNYLNSLLALQEVKPLGADDAIMLDSQGNVTEGTTFSIFAVKHNGTIITPTLEVGILESITRRHVLNVAKANGYRVEEGFYKLNDFTDAAEVFIASSTREIFPVNEWDGKKYPNPGRITTEVLEHLRKEIKAYIAKSPKF